MSDSQIDTLFMIIESLQNKIQNMNITLWNHERELIDLKNQLREKDDRIADLAQSLEFRDLEINDLYAVLDTSLSVDNYMKLQDKNMCLSKDYNNLHQSIKHLFDIEYLL
jgi:chromosome segregation ATPase